MKKSLPRKKSVEAATTCKKKVVSCKKPIKKVSKVAKSGANVPKKQLPKPSTSLSENNPSMISLKDCIARESLTYFEEPTVLQGTRKHKKASRKKSRRSKAISNRSFYNPDEVDFELEDQEFLDDELVSLEEFDSILTKTKGPLGKQNCDEEDFRSAEALREDSPHSVGPGRRKKVQRRRQIDPTTCERDYTTDEVEFMTALDEYKRNSGRMFPTCSEILEVLLGLGYAKTAPPVAQEETSVTAPVPIIGETHTLTFTVAAMPSEYHQEYLPFFLNESLSVYQPS